MFDKINPNILNDTLLFELPTVSKLNQFRQKNFRNRDRVKGGGVTILRQEQYQREREKRSNNETVEHQWIEVSGQKKSLNIVLGNFHQPSSTLQDKIQFLKKFETIFSQVTLPSSLLGTSTSTSLKSFRKLKGTKIF